jgi:anti-anti-sigma regulatory factor
MRVVWEVMAMSATLFKIDGNHVFSALQEARENLDRVDGEVVLDFSSVNRVDVSAVRTLEQLADAADGREIRLTLRGVNVDIYKVLKLTKLTRRFSFG